MLSSEQKRIKDTPSLPKRKIVTKAYGIIWQNIVQLQALPVVYDVDFYLPYFRNCFVESIAKLIIGTKPGISNVHTIPLPI